MFGTLLNLLAKWVPSLLPKLVTERPDLIVDHALAYAALAKRELQATKKEWVRRVLAGAVAIACAISFMLLTGIALMLCATTQPRDDWGWVLFAVPGVMLALALIAAVIAMSKRPPPTVSLSAQMRLDLQAFRAVLEPRP